MDYNSIVTYARGLDGKTFCPLFYFRPKQQYNNSLANMGIFIWEIVILPPSPHDFNLASSCLKPCDCISPSCNLLIAKSSLFAHSLCFPFDQKNLTWFKGCWTTLSLLGLTHCVVHWRLCACVCATVQDFPLTRISVELERHAEYRGILVTNGSMTAQQYYWIWIT